MACKNYNSPIPFSEIKMNGSDNTNIKASEELNAARQRIAQLEALAAQRQIDDEFIDIKAEGLYKAVFESVNDCILIID